MAIPDLSIKKKMTSTFNGTPKEYAEAWHQWHTKYAKNGILSKPDKYRFYNKVGVLYTEEGFKIKPNQSNRKHPRTGKKIDNWTNTLDDGKGDLRKLVRKNREEVLTYMFSGTKMDITKASKLAEAAGRGKRTAHHMFGGAEFGPYIDDIVQGLMSPKGSKANKWARKAVESGRNHFKTSKWFAGNTEEAYRMLTEAQHVAQGTGNPNVHQLEYEQGLTRTAKGGSPIGYAKTQGTVHGLPTDEYISKLPLERKYIEDTGKILGKGSLKGKAFKYVPGGVTKGLTRWDALQLMMENTGPIRDELTRIAMMANPAKGDILPESKVGKFFQEQYGVSDKGTSTVNQWINDIRIAEVKKASWGGKKLGATLPIVGAGFAGWGAFDNVKAAAINPTKHNILKAGGSIVETGGELISAGGILAAPATGGTSLGLVPIGEGIALAGSGADIGATLHEKRKEIKKYASDTFQDKNLPKIRGRSGAKRDIEQKKQMEAFWKPSKEQEEEYVNMFTSKPWYTQEGVLTPLEYDNL